MSSQQKQISSKIENLFLPVRPQISKQSHTHLFSEQNFHENLVHTSSSKSKFDIKKFEHNILKQILSKHQSSNRKKQISNKIQTKQQLSHMNSFKQISNQRKLSRSKSKSKKDLQFRKLNQKQIFTKSHLNNTKILRQKLLNNLSKFDDYQMINIQDSIPILNEANILKILTSLSETKAKIQQKYLPDGRVKQEAKFIYFLWKMINQEFITTRHLKQIIILLNQLNKNDLIDTLGELYNRDGQIIKMFVECWMKLKLDKFFYERSSSKQNENYQTTLNSSKKLPQTINSNELTIKKHEKSKTQSHQQVNSIESSRFNQQNFKNIKFFHPSEQKQLIQRLYEERKDLMNRRQRVKTLNDQQKQNQQYKKCTFKPLLTASYHHSTQKFNRALKRKNQLSTEQFQKQVMQNQQQKQQTTKQRSSSRVKGFQKAVKRLKNGHSQTKLKQQLMTYYSVGQNYDKIKKKPMNPPKFLSREKSKKQELILFVIQFQIGRHKVKVKIHPTDTQMSVSKKISKIYGLKPDQEQEIRSIVSMQLNNYYKKIGQEVSEFIDD